MCASWVCEFKGPKARLKQEAADLWNQLDRSAMPKTPSVPIYRSQGDEVTQPIDAIPEEIEPLKIADKCPSCGSVSLFIGSGGWLTCSSLECKNPCVGDAIAAQKEALVKLWKHTPKIDNVRCMVCRIGYASFIQDGKGNLTVGPCDREDCLSHVVRKALGEV